MTAKENIEKIVRDSITPYKKCKRKISEISMSSEDTQEIRTKTPSKKVLVLKNLDNKKMIYFIFILYIIIGAVILLR